MTDDTEVTTEVPAEVPTEAVMPEPVAAPEAVAVPVADAAPVTVVSAPTLEDRTSVGDILERTARGWIARLHYGGALRLHGEGETIHAALTAAGK